MIPDASIWRSSADYDHLDALTASDVAWEWLRRNDAYDADFEASVSARGDPDPLTERIRQRWGLRFPRRSSSAAS
ncbi:transcriptional regulator domain-containing protein [Paracoccus sp. P2]|uniref:transcriptional regulator domain-containing protein n=1 Tax=Paracoccus sp. P2 TaxID=3248840 RepID=UPI00391EF5A7